jgi:BirA family biotin operon repressor/biotin-[acetyl-CoA-carboxylase] ligase
MSHIRVERHVSVISTQTVATAHVSAGERRVDAVQADFQTEGRGRWGKHWESRECENLLITYLLWDIPVPEPPWELGLIMALAICEVVEERLVELGLETYPKLRWPNDILIEDKKVAGLLLELPEAPTQGKVPIIGVGLNVNQTIFTPPLNDSATSIKRLSNSDSSISEFASNIWDRYHRLHPLLINNPISLATLWRTRDATKGKLYRSPDGRSGIAQGIREDGYLVISWPDGSESALLAADAVL